VTETRNEAAGTRLDPADLDQLRSSGSDIRLLDVRTPAEFESAHIPGAYNVPLDTLGEHAAEIRRHVSETVVVICRSGMRASQAEQKLAAHGMENVKVLDGGMIAWERHGGTVNRGQQRWDLERQVRLVAGSLVLAGIVISVWFPAARFFSGAIGLGLTVAALTNTCVMGMMLAKLPYNRGNVCNVDAVVEQLTGAASRRD
jgi:rhodanese-related sulfurtransferase